ncbi:MAG: hypothetical protein AAF431_05460 [Pseudomonadota bacterium]
MDETLFENIDADVVLFVKVEGRFQKLGKYIARGILVGGISDALTGGLVVVPPGSYAVAQIVALDVGKRNILWHGRAMAEYKNAFPNALKAALRHYPYNDGETEWEKKRKQRRAQ